MVYLTLLYINKKFVVIKRILKMNRIDKEKLFNTILPFVEKPGRYVGQEFNIIKKNLSDVKAKIVLAYPDLYDLGMSYYGFQILYNILNKHFDIAAERVYAPWPDFENKLREFNIPLYSLESYSDIKDFDLLGFTFSYELCYSNVLNMIDLAGIPIFSKDRTQEDPFVIAGGTNAYNPEPMAPFIDFFLIGDGEEILPPVVKFIAEKRKNKISKKDILLELVSKFSGIYAPALYDYNDKDGYYSIPSPKNSKIPTQIIANRVFELKNEYYPEKPIIPLIEITQDRLVAEIMRGCTQGCRFCNAGMIYRPVRERAPENVADQIIASLNNTGYKELSLLSLSTSDYTGLDDMFAKLFPIIEKEKLSVSLPSLRLDSFNENIAGYVKMTRKSGLTFAPEAGSDRLRKVINKHITDEELFNSVEIALKNDWRQIKFYFMIGLPTETKADLDAIVELVEKVLRFSKNRLTLNITLSSFIPKPFTPFQWEKQDSVTEIQEKIDYIKPQLRKLRKIKIMSRDPVYSQLEGVLSRGDRKISHLIYDAWKNGAKFDAWREFFNNEIWNDSFSRLKIDPETYTSAMDTEKDLPWEIINPLVSKKYLLKERQKAYNAEFTVDCRKTCTGCDVCSPGELAMKIVGRKQDFQIPKLKENPSKANNNAIKIRYLINYKKKSESRFTSHLDTLRIFLQAMQRANLDMIYTQGFNKKPRISAGYALPYACTSDDEYLEIYLKKPENELLQKLDENLPGGFEIKSVQQIDNKLPAISSIVTEIDYSITFSEKIPVVCIKLINDFLKRENIIIERKKKNKIRQIDLKNFIKTMELDENILTFTLKVIDGRSVKILEILKVLKLEDIACHCHRKKIHCLKN